jgi:SAM-dependent methyltransferase
MPWNPATYGERWIDIYDSMGWPDPAPAVRFLAEQAGGGTALELTIGTGRVALPLAAAGIEVHGVDASPDMVRAMRQKPGGADIPVTISDISDFTLGREFDLVYLLLNGLYWLQTQEDQLRCFQTVAAHLRPGGRFVIEGFVPDPSRFGSGSPHVHAVGIDQVWLEAGTHDAVNQRVTENHIVIRENGIRLYPSVIRYAWPSELELMARLAGLSRTARYADWAATPYGNGADNHIAVYQKTGSR